MHLNCHTYYSLKYGTLSPEQLADAAQAYGLTSLVLSDINNTSCAYQFIKACERRNIKALLGIEFRRSQKETSINDDVNVFSIKDSKFVLF